MKLYLLRIQAKPVGVGVCSEIMMKFIPSDYPYLLYQTVKWGNLWEERGGIGESELGAQGWGVGEGTDSSLIFPIYYIKG